MKTITLSISIIFSKINFSPIENNFNKTQIWSVHYLLIPFLVICFVNVGQAQLDCQHILPLHSVSFDCGQTSVTLHSNIFNTGATTSYIVDTIPYSPPLPFTAGDSGFVSIDDSWSNIIQLPFNFCFYSYSYDKLVIGTNGLISFDITNAGGYCPWSFTVACPSASLPLNSIFGVYHDIDMSISGKIHDTVLGNSPNRKFIVSFNEIPMFSYNCNTLKATHQIVLHEGTNIIDVYIKNKPLCTSWNSGKAIVGIQNAAGLQGIAAPGRNSTQWTAQNEAWRFTPNGPHNNTVNWYQGTNIISSEDSITVSPTDTSTYYAIVASYTNCNSDINNCIDSVLVTNMHLLPPTTPTIGAITPPTCQIGTGSVVINNLPTTTPWLLTENPGGNVFSGAGDSTIVTGLNPGTYNFSVSTSAACISSLSNDVIINAYPGAPLNPVISTITQPNCTVSTGSIILSNLPASGGWTLVRYPDSITTSGSGGSNNVSGLSTGTYTFVVINSLGCTSAISANAVINPVPQIPPKPIISISNYLLISSAAWGNQWYNQNGLINGANGQSYLVTATGDYFDIVTLNGCSSDTSDIIHIIYNDVSDVKSKPNINIYPNPIAGELIIEAEGKREIEIYNTLGQMVYKGAMLNKTTVSTINFHSGIYLIKIEDNKRFEFRKIIKE